MISGTSYKRLAELEHEAGLNREVLTIVCAFVGCDGHRITLGNNAPVVEKWTTPSKDRELDVINTSTTGNIKFTESYEAGVGSKEQFRPFD